MAIGLLSGKVAGKWGLCKGSVGWRDVEILCMVFLVRHLYLLKEQGKLCWVMALMAEAKPLIEHYCLKQREVCDFPVFSDEAGQHWLVVSGVGKICCSAAVTALYHATGDSAGMAWLNVGIAGHRERSLGELRWVDEIRDSGTGDIWRPPRLKRNGSGKTSGLLTVDEPGAYPEGDTLVDMEASGFYAIASRFSTQELVQCVKIVSDNAQHSWRDVNKGMVKAWIEGRMDEIVAGSEELLSLSDGRMPSEEVSDCKEP